MSSWLCLTDGSTAAARAAACALLVPSRAFIVPGVGSTLKIRSPRVPAFSRPRGSGARIRSAASEDRRSPLSDARKADSLFNALPEERAFFRARNEIGGLAL